MTPEDTIVCLCTRQNFSPMLQQSLLDICEGQLIQWDVVYETAHQHQVSPLVYVNLSKLSDADIGISPNVLSRFKKDQIRNVIVKKRTAAALEEVLALFSQKGIDVMVIKGEALSYLVYERPWYMISYDVDLVIRARREELDETDHRELLELLEGFNHDSNEFKEHIEYDYYEHHDMTMNNVLDVDWGRIWAEAEKIPIKDLDFYVMTPEDMLIASAINSCRKRFIRLKPLCDIATIIERYPDLDWDVIVSKAHAYKCNTILHTALVVTQATLGCHLPEGTLLKLDVHPVRASLVQYLVGKLLQHLTLLDMFVKSANATFDRKFSWPLLLTYGTYRTDTLWPILGRLYDSWRHPSPPVPEWQSRVEDIHIA